MVRRENGHQEASAERAGLYGEKPSGLWALEPEQASNVFCAHQLQMFIMCLLDAVGHIRPAPPICIENQGKNITGRQ